jgi:hypothetical protein
MSKQAKAGQSCLQGQPRQMSDELISTPPKQQIALSGRILAYAPWIVIAVGTFLRLLQYRIDRSLWLDESFLALNIVHRSFSELLKPLDYTQVAPVGFLLIEKLNVQMLGNNEYVLRLFPLSAGIFSLVLFYALAKQTLKRKAVIVAITLFALSGHLIYYSSEVKQYSSDVAVAVLLYVITMHIQTRKISLFYLFLYGGVGALVIWFSSPSVFILTGIGLSFLYQSMKKKEWSKLARLSILFSIWLSSFISFYIYIVSPLNRSGIVSSMRNEWGNSFMPFPPLARSDYQWYIDTFFRIFSNPAGISLIGIAALTFITGCVSLLSRNRQTFFVLLSPVAIALIASTLHMYPFTGRFLLFLIPSFLLTIAEGAAHIMDKTRSTSPIVGGILVGLLLFFPILSAGTHIVTRNPYSMMSIENIGPVMRYMNDHREKGDIIYIYYAAQYAYKYYAERYGFDENECLVGVYSRNNWSNYMRDLNKLRGKKRVWLLFSHVCTSKGVDEEKLFLYYLDSLGSRLDQFKSAGASVYLYDLSKDARTSLAGPAQR